MVMRWRPWPAAAASKKFLVRLVVRRMNGAEGEARVKTVVRWKGAPRVLRRTVVRNCTREAAAREEVVQWDEEFETVCALSGFHPWEVELQVFNGMTEGPKEKASVIGTASLNLAEFTSIAKEEFEINLPLAPVDVTRKSHASLHLTLHLLELRVLEEPSDVLRRLPAPLSHLSDSLPSEKDEFSVLKAGLRKVKGLTDLVSTRKAKKALRDDEGSEGRSSRSDVSDTTYPFDTDSLDDDPDVEELDHKDDSTIRKSYSYGSLASANFVDGSVSSDMLMRGEYEDWVYYSPCRSNGGSHAKEVALCVPGRDIIPNSKRSILPWKKRKLIPRSTKAKGGEPLLKKAYKEDGGDDIDYDRRQLSSSDESLSTTTHSVDDGAANRLSISEFGDDNFEIGRWETKEVVSRDGHMKLSAHVLFASMDQTGKRAAGGGACSALAVVIANWFQTNQDTMPIKSQFDSLIKEGSREWRSLCENPKYRQRFDDNHFDLETVVEANICPLSFESGKSFVGFFRPDATDNEDGLSFLSGAMSFDDIWDQIRQAGSEGNAYGSPLLYIISWNDHFFVLKVEQNAYYIIDTLGERLHEGCKQGYILKFDERTSINRILSDSKTSASETVKSGKGPAQKNANVAQEEELVCRGKECCKEYIKRFLAAIPIREVQDDLKKGHAASTLLYQRLQIEFHYTATAKVSEDAFR